MVYRDFASEFWGVVHSALDILYIRMYIQLCFMYGINVFAVECIGSHIENISLLKEVLEGGRYDRYYFSKDIMLSAIKEFCTVNIQTIYFVAKMS